MNNDNTLEQLNAVYVRALTNTRSAFYRGFYSSGTPKSIDSFETWRSLPLLTRERIIETPLKERIFVPYEKVEMLSATSGTSGKNVLITPRAGGSQTAYMHGRMPNGVLSFYQPLHLLTQTRDRHGWKYPAICIDPSEVECGVKLITRLGIDTIICHPSLLKTLIPSLQKDGLTESIKSIFTFGEKASYLQYDELCTIFPNAIVLPGYGASELQKLAAFADLDVEEARKNIMRPSDDFFWEVLDEERTVLTYEGAEGELVLTTISKDPIAFPLLRYATGEYVRIVKLRQETARCRYEIIGRSNIDMIKLPGGLLYAQEVERVLGKTHPALSGDFQVHVYRSGVDDFSLNITVVPKENISLTKELQDTLTITIASDLRVSPNLVYNDLVKRGLCKALTITLVPKITTSSRKRVYFIQHYDEK